LNKEDDLNEISKQDNKGVTDSIIDPENQSPPNEMEDQEIKPPQIDPDLAQQDQGDQPADPFNEDQPPFDQQQLWQ
jgi:hypothetical protein